MKAWTAGRVRRRQREAARKEKAAAKRARREGRAHEIRPCIGLQGCSGGGGCVMNPTNGLEMTFGVTKLAPTRVVGLMMGVWFLSNALGNKLAGWAAGFISTMPIASLFGATAAAMLGAAVIMFLLLKPVRNLMGGVN